MSRSYFHMPIILAAVLWVPLSAIADEKQNPSDEQLVFFETKVRPLLAENCHSCHGPKKQKGNLRLDSLSTILSGGESGPAIVKGKSSESLLIEAVNYESLEMPPSGKLKDERGKLKDEQIAILTRWIDMGAPWSAIDRDGPVQGQAAPMITDQDRSFWSFQPLRKPPVPVIAGDDWSKNEIDRFILRRFRQEGLSPAPEADRLSIVRRVYFDLVGLPPTPAEIDEFVNDKSPTAYEDLIDRLLDDSRYGERWARHWLDLVRYAESDGYKQDAYRSYAWRYRDYVIRSLNQDKPYSQFVMEQLAGDEIAPEDPNALVATGFLRHWIYEFNQRDVRAQWDSIINDITDVTGEVFLGMGMRCARCHDHKFDPILQKDYYRLRAFFAAVLPTDEVPIATPERRSQYEKQLSVWEQKTADIRRRMAELEKPLMDRAVKSALTKFQPDIQALLNMSPSRRTPLEQQLASIAGHQIIYERSHTNIEAGLKGEKKKQWIHLKKKLAEFYSVKPKPLPVGYTVIDVGREAPPTIIPGSDQVDIAPGYLAVLSPSEPPAISFKQQEKSTGRRTALAQWITQPDNPLSTRVIVNRIWQYHFGRGLVETSSDFGHLGLPPSHPELLDFLASRFTDRGWSFKKTHRLIMNSATYRQAALSSVPKNALLKDPGNRLLWQRNIRRLDAEQIRDAMLATSGELDSSFGGPSVETSQPRRTIYTKIFRNKHNPLLEVFDAPDGFSSTSKRNVTTTPTQALFMINGDWTLQRAAALAKRLKGENLANDSEIVDRAYRLVFGRHATLAEQDIALAFLKDQAALAISAKPSSEKSKSAKLGKPADQTASSNAALTDFCHVLLNSSEFLYID